MARLVKRKRRLKIEGFATLFLTFAVVLFLLSTFALKSFNITLSQQSQDLATQQTELQQAVNNVKAEVEVLQNRDRVLAIAGEDGIKSNQNNVTIMSDE